MLLNENPTARYVMLLRSFVFGMWLFKFLIDPIEQLAELPAAGFFPPSPIGWLPRFAEFWFLSSTVLVSLRGVSIMSALFCLIPSTFRWFAPICCIAATIEQSLLRGFGHTNHAEVGLLIASYVFAVGAWFRRGSIRSEPLTIAFLFLLTYSLTASFRITNGGLHIFTSDAIVWWTTNNSSRVNYFDFTLGDWLVSRPWTWPMLKFGLAAITVIELLSPYAIVSRRFRLMYLVSMLGFHLGVLLTMNILFWENTVLLLLLLSPGLFSSMSDRSSTVNCMSPVDLVKQQSTPVPVAAERSDSRTVRR